MGCSSVFLGCCACCIIIGLVIFMYLADKIKDFNETNNADKVLSESFGREAKSRFAYFAYWFRIGLVLFWLVSCLLLTGCGAKDSDGWQIGKSLDPQIVESYVNKDISSFRFYEKEGMYRRVVP